MDPKNILSPDDYSNYQKIRRISSWFVFVGLFYVAAGILGFFDLDNRKAEPIGGIICLIGGIASIVGGFSAEHGNRRWAPLIYPSAFLSLFAFPVGTILGFTMLSGLGRFLESLKKLEEEQTVAAQWSEIEEVPDAIPVDDPNDPNTH